MSSSRATKRTAAAAAGFGMVLASFAGAAASATAATHHSPASTHRITPDVPIPAEGVTLSIPAPLRITLAEARAATPETLPTITVTDPGAIPSGDTVTLGLSAGGNFGSLLPTVPTVTVSGAGVTAGPATVNTGAGTISFTVTKATPGTAATYAVSGAAVAGTPISVTSGFDVALQASHVAPGPVTVTDLEVAPIALGAVTSIIPAAYGETAPDTAAVLFRAQEPSEANTHSVVLASDYEPQDAESANYLADQLDTGILLTDPTTLSPAAASVLSDYDIDTVYIVGGTSVVSAAIEAQLDATYGADDVIRLAGADAYATNQFVNNYLAEQGDSAEDYQLDYTRVADYNDTTGTSSASTTAVGDAKTAIVVSGSIDSYQDGVVSGALSYGEGFPVILTTPTTLSPSALSQLTEGQYKQVILLGGPSAVSDSVVSQLTASTASGGAGVVVFRVAGQDASDTSTKLAAFMADPYEIDDYSYTDDGVPDGGVLIARGSGFQDALAAGPYAGGNGFTPILLTENATTLGAPLTAYLKELASDQGIFAVQAIGGPLSVTAAVQQAASDAQFSGLTP